MSVSLVWFKRDLRVSDNQALQEAVNSQLPVICLFNLESERIHRKDYLSQLSMRSRQEKKALVNHTQPKEMPK